MKLAILLLTLTLTFFTLANAQDRPAVTAQPNSVYVGADGKFESCSRHRASSIQHQCAGGYLQSGL